MAYKITESRILYVYSIEAKDHNGYLKIGEFYFDNDLADIADFKDLKQEVVRRVNDCPSTKELSIKDEYAE